MKKYTSQEGISILFVVLIMSVMLAIGMGISAILVQQTKMLSEIGQSVVAFYAAESGIEEAISDLYKSALPQAVHEGSVGKASFIAETSCGKDVLPEDCPVGFEINPDCSAANYCLKSIGFYKNTRRAIEITY